MSNRQSQNIQIENLKVIISSLLLILFFFLPWIEFSMLKNSAWDLLKILNNTKEIINKSNQSLGTDYSINSIGIPIFLLYLIPLLSAYLIISAVINKNEYFLITQYILFSIICFLSYNFFIVNNFDFNYVGPGFWGTILVGLYLLVEFILNLLANKSVSVSVRFFTEKNYNSIMNVLIRLFFGCSLYAFYDLFIKNLLT